VAPERRPYGKGNSPAGPAFVETDLPPSEEEERALVEAAQKGSAQAYAEIIERYHARVYGIIYRMCGPQDAEDLTQDVFVRALRALRRFQFQGQASLRTWLYRIAVNSAINELRRRGRRKALHGPSLEELQDSEGGGGERVLPDYSQVPSVLVEREELRRAVHQTLAQLSPKHRAVLVLVDLEGLPYEQAASIVGCPLGTLKSRLARARTVFARLFSRYLHGNMRVDYAPRCLWPRGR
jgi:RNA polymerase sigma-70 factor (ECF subfamily)